MKIKFYDQKSSKRSKTKKNNNEINMLHKNVFSMVAYMNII